MTRLLPAGADVYVVEERSNPSSDYFVLPACGGDGRRVHRCSFDELPTAEALAGAVVIFVRYVPRRWREQVERVRARLAGLVFFMDDDVLDPASSRGMPWRYRYKLWTLGSRHARWLRAQRARLWVSTPWLARKYADWSPERIDPRPVAVSSGMCRVFYHGSASHGAEILWLRPVMQQVLRSDERTAFEIVGGQDVYRAFRGLPRVTVVHPMKWEAYQGFIDMPGRHIGLAPLLDLPFNRGRSCTKFYDITRAGAAGIYAESSACASVVRNGTDGIVLPMQQDAWAEAIVELARDTPRRLALLENARLALATRQAGGG